MSLFHATFKNLYLYFENNSEISILTWYLPSPTKGIPTCERTLPHNSNTVLRPGLETQDRNICQEKRIRERVSISICCCVWFNSKKKPPTCRTIQIGTNVKTEEGYDTHIIAANEYTFSYYLPLVYRISHTSVGIPNRRRRSTSS